jgi:hypothetical protein
MAMSNLEMFGGVAKKPHLIAANIGLRAMLPNSKSTISKAEARRIAANIAKLAQLLCRS